MYPADQRHGAEQEAAWRGGEECVELAEDLRCVGDGVLREHQAQLAGFTAAPSASTEAERCTASRPPTPFSVKPQPN